MNKAFRILFLISLTTIVCASCHKVEELFPESFERNDKPFSIEAVPPEGCDSIVFYRIRVSGNDTLIEKFNLPNDTISFNRLNYSIGDSIILEAYPKNGYTFINWVRDGVRITDSTGVDISTQPVYSFTVNKNDTILKTENHNTLVSIKYHYEARFGIDYALQVIPSIEEVMPADLIAAMGPYLYFGDNPPKIDLCFSLPDSIMLHTLIKANPNGAYNFVNEATWPKPCDCTSNSFIFENQHRCVAESHYYERQYYHGDIIYYATAEDSIFIMGHDSLFTAYFHQTWKPYSTYSNIPLLSIESRRESVILSGIKTDEGIKRFQWGVRIESYSPANSTLIDIPPGSGGQPGVHDIMVFSSDRTLYYDPNFQRHF